MIALLADRDHGIATRDDLRGLGVTRRMIARRRDRGLLIELYDGVFAVGHAHLTPAARRFAAVRAAGPGSYLGHQSGAAHMNLMPWSGRHHVVAPRGRTVSSADVVVHHYRRLDDADVTVADGVPTLAWPRLVVELGTVLDSDRLSRVLEEVVLADLWDENAIDAAIRRARGHHGLRTLAAALALGRHSSPQRTRSPLEIAFLGLVRAAAPPLAIVPRLNLWVPFPEGGGCEVDACIPERMHAIELDSRRHHDLTNGQRWRDEAKAVRLERLGYSLDRFTWRDVTRRPDAVLAAVRAVTG